MRLTLGGFRVERECWGLRLLMSGYFIRTPGPGAGIVRLLLPESFRPVHLCPVHGYPAAITARRQFGKGIQCWGHARRKLCDIHDSHRSTIAAEGRWRIAAMYAIEKEIRGEPPDVRLAVRRPAPPPGQGLRSLAAPATRPDIAVVVPEREAGLHRQPLGRASGVLHRLAGRDGYKYRGKQDTGPGAQSEERAVRRP